MKVLNTSIISKMDEKVIIAFGFSMVSVPVYSNSEELPARTFMHIS